MHVDSGAPRLIEVRGPRLAPGTLSALLLAMLAAVVIGTYRISIADVFRVIAARLAGGADGGIAAAVIWSSRIPRVLLALVGAALASSGAVFQASFATRSSSYPILGVSSGAAFGAALGMVAPHFPLSVPLAAILGALAAVGLVHLLARSRGDAPIVTLVLSGIIVGSMFAAGVSMLKYLADEAALRDIVFWLMGGFYFANWPDVAMAAPVVLAAAIVMIAGGWRLNVLSMGDHEAETLGIDPKRTRRVLLAAATLATAVSVSASASCPGLAS
jgi:iron complex transport system permease protein